MSKTTKPRRTLSLEVPEAALRIHADTLQEAMKAKEPGLVIIDVRGEDYKGGHITGCHNVPYDEFSDALPGLVKAHKDAKKVVFCCMDAQVRSPSCAVTFIMKLNEDNPSAETRPEVYLLIGGVQGWIRANHADSALVEDFDEKLWAAIWEATGESAPAP
eukprot:RCo038619